MQRNFEAIAISDLHFGVVPTKRLLNELDEVFFKYIQKNKSIDLIVICGDLTDKALSYNEEASKGALLFMNKIAKKVIIYSMVGLLQLGFGVSVSQAAQRNPEPPPPQEQGDDRNHPDREHRIREENERHEREMRRRDHE